MSDTKKLTLNEREQYAVATVVKTHFSVKSDTDCRAALAAIKELQLDPVMDSIAAGQKEWRLVPLGAEKTFGVSQTTLGLISDGWEELLTKRPSMDAVSILFPVIERVRDLKAAA